MTAKRQRSACIVGAAGGIGRATTALLAEQGYSPLICMDLAESGVDALAAEHGAVALHIDLRDPAGVPAAFAKAREQCAELDVLVLVSGIVENLHLDTMTLDLWQDILTINLTGMFACTKAADSWLADGGRVVLLGSMAGHAASRVTGPAYSASKGGIEAFTKYLGRYFAPRGITANCIAPGPIDTPMLDAHPPERMKDVVAAVPMGRLGQPQEVAALVAYLVSPGAGYTSGAIINISGGL
ncbi:MAG: SDR family oxidoreductase [Proteobacteria bacterium]|nr:SDR family oxidoreductase [Pseudomonadota bacterium]MDA1058386.1 SDR family oxidoreductase [Pseudomonadota bacterium]